MTDKATIKDSYTVTANPYQAKFCKDCEVWIFTDAAPFGENDRTKTVRDALHYEKYHQPAEDFGKVCIGFPAMTYNDKPVEAIVEAIKGGRLA